MGSKDYGHRPYVDDHLGYVENITNLTRKALQDAGISILAPQPYFDVGMNEQYYNSQGVDDPRYHGQPKPITVPEPVEVVFVPPPCTGAPNTYFCIHDGPVTVQFGHKGSDFITKVEIVSGDGTVAFDGITEIATYTPGTVGYVELRATTVAGNTCTAILYTTAACCAATGSEGIAYTSRQMHSGTSQTFVGTNLSPDCLAYGQYRWEVRLQSGYLVTSGTGPSITVNLPNETNVMCGWDLSIRLYCKDVLLTHLHIGVNSVEFVPCNNGGYAKRGSAQGAVCTPSTYWYTCYMAIGCAGYLAPAGCNVTNDPYCDAFNDNIATRLLWSVRDSCRAAQHVDDYYMTDLGISERVNGCCPWQFVEIYGAWE